jgi:hypothetical protein
MNIETSYWVEVAVFFACLVGIYDWAIQNSYLAGPSILDLLHRREEKYGHLLLGFIRLRSTVEEAGHFGLFLNAFVPLSLLHQKSSKLWFVLYSGVVITAYVFTMSIATWGMAMIAMVIALLLLPQKRSKEFVAICVIIIAGAITVLLLISTENQLSLRILNAQKDISFVQRANMYSTVFNRLMQADIGSWLLGYGPASFIDSVGSNPISWYLLFLHDLGILALFCVIFLGYYVIGHIRRANCSVKQKILLQMSALTLMLHYLITANFWHPWLWVVFPLIFNFVRSSNKKPLTVNR